MSLNNPENCEMSTIVPLMVEGNLYAYKGGIVNGLSSLQIWLHCCFIGSQVSYFDIAIIIYDKILNKLKGHLPII